ncbi:MAG TPA: FAD binding domain-containing protein, partial [Acidimicrobiia bacterium]|nr:FAD binding domain-containing protein [Acidimicrobiia bacterium]
MYPRAFDYMAASSLDQASQALSETPGAKLLSGGMSLLPMMKLRILSPSMVVDLGKVPGLDAVGVEEDSLVIGALVR